MLAVFDHNVGINPTTNIEFRPQAHEARLADVDQIVEDFISDVLVKGAFVAKRPDIQFKGLQLDAKLVRYVLKEQRGKIGLTGLWAQAGKFRRANVDGVIPVRVWIGKGFEILAGLR